MKWSSIENGEGVAANRLISKCGSSVNLSTSSSLPSPKMANRENSLNCSGLLVKLKCCSKSRAAVASTSSCSTVILLSLLVCFISSFANVILVTAVSTQNSPQLHPLATGFSSSFNQSSAANDEEDDDYDYSENKSYKQVWSTNQLLGGNFYMNSSRDDDVHICKYINCTSLPNIFFSRIYFEIFFSKLKIDFKTFSEKVVFLV